MTRSLISFSSLLQNLAVVTVGLVVLCTLSSFDADFARILANNAPYVTFGLFILGIVSLIAQARNVMIAAFVGASIMAVVLRSTVIDVNPKLSAPVAEYNFQLRVAQFSTSNLALDAPYGLRQIVESNNDIVSVQGLTPDWAEYLNEYFATSFPYHYAYEDIGLQGIGLYSREPLGFVDSMHIGDIVHLSACVSTPDPRPDVELLVLQTMPPINSAAYYKLTSQLNAVAGILEESATSTIVLGDFNSVPWSAEFQNFQQATALRDSRSSVQSAFVKGAPYLFEVPVEHILYSQSLRCVDFKTLRSKDGYLGNSATFQDKKSISDLAAL